MGGFDKALGHIIRLRGGFDGTFLGAGTHRSLAAISR